METGDRSPSSFNKSNADQISFLHVLTNQMFLKMNTILTSNLAPPSPPVNLNIKDLTSRSVTLTWEPPLNDGGSEITGYVVEKKLEYMPKWEKVYTLEAFTLEYTFENLKEKSDYVFRVYAENAVGLSAPAQTDVVQMRTLASKYYQICYEMYQYLMLLRF